MTQIETDCNSLLIIGPIKKFDVRMNSHHVHINDKIQYDVISKYRLTDRKTAV